MNRNHALRVRGLMNLLARYSSKICVLPTFARICSWQISERILDLNDIKELTERNEVGSKFHSVGTAFAMSNQPPTVSACRNVDEVSHTCLKRTTERPVDRWTLLIISNC